MARFNAADIHTGYRSAGIRSRALPHCDIGHVSSNLGSSARTLGSVLNQLFVFLLLLSSMNVVTALTRSSGEQTQVKVFSGGVDTFSVAIQAGLYTYGGVLLLTHWRRVLRAVRIVWPLLALAGLACLSVAWSVQPVVTLRRSLDLL